MGKPQMAEQNWGMTLGKEEHMGYYGENMDRFIFSVGKS